MTTHATAVYLLLFLLLNFASLFLCFGIHGQEEFPFSEFFTPERESIRLKKILIYVKGEPVTWSLDVALGKTVVLKLKTVALINFGTGLYRWKDI